MIWLFYVFGEILFSDLLENYLSNKSNHAFCVRLKSSNANDLHNAFASVCTGFGWLFVVRNRVYATQPPCQISIKLVIKNIRHAIIC